MKHILYIEDDTTIVDVTTQIINMSFDNVDIDISYNMESAIKKIESDNNYDIIISDCHLPDGMACELFPFIKHNVPLIVTTGELNVEDKLKNEEVKIPDEIFFLIKPFKFSDFIDLISNVIGE